MENKIYFNNLDGLRTVAFLMVFIQHGFSRTIELLQIENVYLNKFLMLISSGGNGVSIFFVLSGFLITYLIIREINEKSTINIFNFYKYNCKIN